jgi:hypothetical protein
MAPCEDPEVQNALVVEVFENLDGSRSITRRIVKRLVPSSQALYADWVGANYRPSRVLPPAAAHDLVFHGPVREPPREQVRQEHVQKFRVLPLPPSLGDHDPADARVARPRDPEPGGHRPEQAPRLRVGHAEGVEDAEGEHELRVDRRVEGHPIRVARRGLCG